MTVKNISQLTTQEGFLSRVIPAQEKAPLSGKKGKGEPNFAVRGGFGNRPFILPGTGKEYLLGAEGGGHLISTRKEDWARWEDLVPDFQDSGRGRRFRIRKKGKKGGGGFQGGEEGVNPSRILFSLRAK